MITFNMAYLYIDNFYIINLFLPPISKWHQVKRKDQPNNHQQQSTLDNCINIASIHTIEKTVPDIQESKDGGLNRPTLTLSNRA